MYPFIRLFWQAYKHRKDPKLGLLEVHESTHYCMPWDIDLWMELNNGRTLTLFDLGRVPLGQRTGLFATLKRHNWGLAVAGSTTRYRRRVRAFDKITMKSRCIGFDERFVYIEQAMFHTNGECANHVIIRAAITSKSGIVPTQNVIAELGGSAELVALPEWVRLWIDAAAQRPWPPMQA